MSAVWLPAFFLALISNVGPAFAGWVRLKELNMESVT